MAALARYVFEAFEIDPGSLHRRPQGKVAQPQLLRRDQIRQRVVYTILFLPRQAALGQSNGIVGVAFVADGKETLLGVEFAPLAHEFKSVALHVYLVQDGAGGIDSVERQFVPPVQRGQERGRGLAAISEFPGGSAEFEQRGRVVRMDFQQAGEERRRRFFVAPGVEVFDPIQQRVGIFPTGGVRPHGAQRHRQHADEQAPVL